MLLVRGVLLSHGAPLGRSADAGCRRIGSKYKGRMDSRSALATYHLEPIKVLEYILRHGSEGVGSSACPILDGIFGRGHVGGFGP